jgi:hypothetical protein
METNTVLLNLQDYDELLLIKNALENKKVVFVNNWTSYYGSLDKEDFVTMAAKEIDILRDEIEELKKPKDNLSISDIKKMSLFQLIKWKLSDK